MHLLEVPLMKHVAYSLFESQVKFSQILNRILDDLNGPFTS